MWTSSDVHPGAPRNDLRGAAASPFPLGHVRPVQSEAGSGLAALTAIAAPSQLSTPAPDEVQSSSTVPVASTQRLPMRVEVPGSPDGSRCGEAAGAEAAGTIGCPPHAISGRRSAGTRMTTTFVLQTVLASWSPGRSGGAGGVINSSPLLSI